jgi:hypothetical protein
MADPKATLTIKLETPSNQRWSGALPIEVRDSEKLVLKARGISDDKLEVPPGRYFVTALLPNGGQATVDEVVVLEAGDTKELEIPISDLSFPPTLESTSTFQDSLWEISRPVTQYFFRQLFAVLKGNWLAGKISGAESQTPLKREPTTRSNLDIPFSREAAWIEIESSRKYNYFAVPVDEAGSTTVEWALDIKSEKLNLKFDFHDGELNLFLDFIENDRALEARSISQILVMRPDYYASKKQSPLRATLGAYVLLRANLLEGLETWTSNLVSSFTWLPDALAIRVEYLARNGRHQEAVKLLLDFPKWGAPLFRSGIGYMADRAKTYARLVSKGGTDLQVEGADQHKLEQIAQVFGELADSLDMTHSTSALRQVPRI